MHISPGNWIENRFYTCFNLILFDRSMYFNKIVPDIRSNAAWAKTFEDVPSLRKLIELETERLPSLQDRFYLALTDSPGRTDGARKLISNETATVPELVLGEYGSRPGSLIFQFDWEEVPVQIRAVNNYRNGVTVDVFWADKEHGLYGNIWTDSPFGSCNDVRYIRECFYRTLLEDVNDWPDRE